MLPDHLRYREFLRTSKAEWSINDHYAEHQSAARALAEQYFEAKKVCQNLLVQAGVA